MCFSSSPFTPPPQGRRRRLGRYARCLRQRPRQGGPDGDEGGRPRPGPCTGVGFGARGRAVGAGRAGAGGGA